MLAVLPPNRAEVRKTVKTVRRPKLHENLDKYEWFWRQLIEIYAIRLREWLPERHKK